MDLDFHTEGIPHVEDVSFEDQAHWTYRGFHRFRQRLAAEMEQQKHLIPIGYLEVLQQFLEHPDCYGILTAAQCEVLTKQIAFLVWEWEPKDDYDRINAIKLCAHMNYCAGSGRNLVFR